MGKHRKWLFFSSQVDINGDGGVAQSQAVAYAADRLRGMAPADTTGDTRMTLHFDPAYALDKSTEVCDTIPLTIGANTHLDVMTKIVQAINTTKPTNGGFVAIADNTVKLNDGTAKESEFIAEGITCENLILNGIGGDLGFVDEIAATTDGTGTGRIPAVGGYYKVTSDGDDKIVTLPLVSSGVIIWLDFADTTHDFELRSNSPGSIKINGGSGSNAETEIAKANVLVRCIKTSSGWIVNSFAADGTESAEAAAA